MSESPVEYGARSMPHDEVAEQSVLGGMLLSKDAIADVVEVLRAGDFYKPAHELIYEAILSLYGHGEPADPVTVAAQLKKQGELTRAGGAVYLDTLTNTVPTAASSAYYADIVKNHAIMRRLIEAGTKIARLGYDGDAEVDQLVDAAQAEIYAVSDGNASDDYKPFSEVLEATVQEIQANADRPDGVYGVPTDFAEFDDLTGGLHPGQMIVIAARPGVGKSTLALDFARSAAIKHNMTTAFFSLEMSHTELAIRIISAEAKLSMGRLKKGELEEYDGWSRLSLAQGKMQSAPLFIDDSPNMTLMEIRAKCRRLKQRNNLQLVVLDYLQLMSSGKRVESRQQEVSEFSRSLKLLAKELEVPVIALSQLNRGSEQRTDKRPMISDLRESGSIEQDADMVILLHREDMYDPDSPRVGEADMIIAKHRGGPTKTISLGFQGKYSRFTNLAPNIEEPRGA
ncbi:MAG: replicative DNA helicase [Rothia sp. (in: high G+C Gram-positive bacteria)]|uniref:replicative DNA helicase n=1 Tax=Rothia sp. (in: high G+C Gram-positive bacteria) TaxID=1885016 RepID=UPI0026DFC649|nr:replicative DNA helicase [Rothia sp. (in: high G+C Gram-positive bacteria)]MDO5749575.1 replicative DNA helicase [Rothia sp. (in: high G+C Gram-positive bacteria)]